MVKIWIQYTKKRGKKYGLHSQETDEKGAGSQNGPNEEYAFDDRIDPVSAGFLFTAFFLLAPFYLFSSVCLLAALIPFGGGHQRLYADRLY